MARSILLRSLNYLVSTHRVNHFDLALDVQIRTDRNDPTTRVRNPCQRCVCMKGPVTGLRSRGPM